MNDVSTETQVAKKFDPEAFAMNLARAMESSGQALAAYLKPRESGEITDKPPGELAEVVKTFSAVADYWLSDKDPSAELQMKIVKAYLDLWGSAEPARCASVNPTLPTLLSASTWQRRRAR